MTDVITKQEPRDETTSRIELVDCDVHSATPYAGLTPYLEARWREYLGAFGVRTRQEADAFPGVRTPGRRADAIPPSGGPPGSDPEFARAQLLDEYGVDIAILNCVQAQTTQIGHNQPGAFSAALSRATNDWTADVWFTSDDRWRAAIHTVIEEPRFAVAEIERCLKLSERFVQVALPGRSERPLGHSKYWDLFELVSEHDLPMGIHPGGTGGHSWHASGVPSTFYELHVGLHFGVFSTIASLIFEGVFDRWPKLKFVFTECGWAWAAPLAWRLDASWKVLASEVPELERKPSEYFADHFWFTTQPMESPSDPSWFPAVYEQFASAGFEGHLLFSTDYPHWDFDSPRHAVPHSLPQETRQGIFSGNAIALHHLA